MAHIDLFAIQAYVGPEDYASEEAFRRKIFGLMAQAQQKRDPALPALAVFPENIGSFLALAEIGELAARMPSVDAATALGALTSLPSVLARLAAQGAEMLEPGALPRAVLLSAAARVREIYERTFSDAAREHRMAIVAGSALLAEGDKVYNASLTFDEGGEIAGRARKVNLVPVIEDRMGLSRGAPEDLYPAALRVGHVGTLICYDGFDCPHTAEEPWWRQSFGPLIDRWPKIIAQPAANPWPWEGPWVHARPGEARPRSVQWRDEGLASSLRRFDKVRYAITAHLIGAILDTRFDGRSEIFGRSEEGEVHRVAAAKAFALDPASEEAVHARVEAPWLDR